MMPALAHRMTVSEAEALLASTGLSLRRVRHDPATRRLVATVASAGDFSGETFEASGTDLENLVENAVGVARRRPARPGGVRRWRS